MKKQKYPWIFKFVFSLLCSLGMSLTSVHAASGLFLLKNFITETRTLTAQFEQHVSNKQGQSIQNSTGKLSLFRPNLFRWDVAPPNTQHIVGDGQRVWVYDPDLNQVTVKKLSDALGQTPASFLAGEADLEKKFNFVELGENKGLIWLEATPRGQEKQFEKIRLGFKMSSAKQAQLAAMLIEDAFGQKTQILFHHMQQNPKIDQTQFKFNPPKGADILE